ncbi:OB-fold protein [Kineococcus esterisolvens]|uniref:OB-fold protein n=1 Tax=unclassified Kineococcus TaxID=2621656 RepID=UPI003D7E00D4
MSHNTQGNPGPYYGAPQDPREARALAQAEKAYRRAQRPWHKKKRFMLPLLFFGFLFVVGACSAALGGDNSSKVSTAPAETNAAAPAEPGPAEPAPAEPAPAEPAPAEPAPAEPAPAEPAVVVSSQEMIDALEGNALKAKNTYEGKRVTVSGFVGNIDASGDYFALDPEPDAIVFTGVQVQTGKEFLDQVANLSAGQEVTVTGTVTSVGEILGYSLEAETIK